MPLKSNISKKDMTEEDIKNRFVTPALNQAGWESGLILMEKYFNPKFGSWMTGIAA